MLRLPNFFIVGAPKAGTTSAYHYLSQHPQIYMSPVKEPHYFAPEVRNCDPELKRRPGGLVTNRNDYLRLFEGAQNAVAIGEASVCYLWSPTAANRIASEVPDARIIIMLRDPAERAFSQYLQSMGSGDIRWGFREHIQRNLDHRTSQICVHYPFLEFGFYFEQVRRYRALFGNRVWIGFHEDYKSRPRELCRDLFTFLGVDPDFRSDVQKRYLEAQVPRGAGIAWLKRAGVWQTVANLTPRGIRPLIRRALIRKPGTTKVDPVDRRYLTDLYREDIYKLANELGRDLSGWLTS